MTNEEKNTALYKKLFAEQDAYREWLLSQSPETILNHAYEYVIREDILLSLEENDLTDAQADALLGEENPLADTLREFEKRETGHMEEIFDTLEKRADAVLADQAKQKKERMKPVKEQRGSVREKLQKASSRPKKAPAKQQGKER